MTLALGQVAETVTVQANTSLVETRNMGVGQVMDNKRILDLPLNGRNPADLLQFLPAAVPQPLLNATSRSMQGGLAYSVAGGLPFGVSYVLDGATHNNPYDNLNLPLPFPDALQEFKAETSALTAQNGMHSGAAVNAVTKSGTNQYRGDLFEFFRDQNLNATDPFADKNPDGTRKRDGLKRNQYGATLGGPVKADKMFFFAGYQGTNTRVNPTDNRAFVPTPAMLAGDFTAFASPACNAGRQINLPAPFAGNRVNPALFSKAALNITSRLPTTTDPCGLVQYGLPSATDESQFVGKLDYQPNARHSTFGRYIATKVYTPPPFDLEAAQENLLVTRIGGRDNLAQTFTVGENWVLSNTTLNSLRFAFNRTSIHRTSTDFFSAPEVGINIYSYMPHYMLLTVGSGAGSSITGFQLGNGMDSEATFNTNAWQVSDDLTLVRGDHQFAVGANVAHWASLSLANVRSPGQLLIDGSQTGLPLTDFLLGRMGINGLAQAAPNTLDMTRTYLGVYAQDTWRLGQKVTLNYGLRWEPFFPPQLVNGAVYQFDVTRFQQNVKSTVFPNAPAGLYFPGDPGFPSQAGMLHTVGESRATRRARLGSGRGRAYGDPGVVREVVRVCERTVPPRHVGRAALGLRRPYQQPVWGPGQSVCRLGSDQYLPGDVRPERALLVERAVHQSERRHEIHTRPFVEHDRRAADRELVRFCGVCGKPYEQHLGIDAAQQRLVRHGQRRCAEHREHQRASSVDAGGSGEREILRTCGSLCHRRNTALQRHDLVGTARLLANDAERELHVVALLRFARGFRWRREQHQFGVQQAPGSRIRRRQLRGRSAPQLHGDGGNPVA